MEVYKNEPDVKRIRDQFDRDFQNALQGRQPVVKVKVPEFLTKDKLLELENKLTKSKDNENCRKIFASDIKIQTNQRQNAGVVDGESGYFQGKNSRIIIS